MNWLWYRVCWGKSDVFSNSFIIPSHPDLKTRLLENTLTELLDLYTGSERSVSLEVYEFHDYSPFHETDYDERTYDPTPFEKYQNFRWGLVFDVVDNTFRMPVNYKGSEWLATDLRNMLRTTFGFMEVIYERI